MFKVIEGEDKSFENAPDWAFYVLKHEDKNYWAENLSEKSRVRHTGDKDHVSLVRNTIGLEIVAHRVSVTYLSAHYFLEKGVQHMKDRAAQRDSEDGERSMKACVDAFNAMFGHNLTETQGWQFMVLLKMARSRNKFNPDDYEDGAAYTGLAGEAHSHEQK